MIRQAMAWALGISLLLNVLAGIAVPYVWNLWQLAKAENRTLVAKLDAAVSANAATVMARNRLQDALDGCRDLVGRMTMARDETEAAHAQAVARLRQRLTNERRVLERELDATDCEMLRRVPVCPAVADRLRAQGGDTD